MTSETEVENEIIAKGKTAPRLTPTAIDATIVDEVYFTAEQGYQRANADAGIPVGSYAKLGILTFCVLILRNGFVVTGESACASPDNFDAEIGRKVAKENAREKIWALEAYLLKERLSAGADDQR
jgi:hypothetical protein